MKQINHNSLNGIEYADFLLQFVKSGYRMRTAVFFLLAFTLPIAEAGDAERAHDSIHAYGGGE